MPVCYLTERDVAGLATMKDALAVMEGLFADWGEVASQNVARQRIRMPHGMFNLLGAGYGPRDAFGVKAYFASPAGARFQILLYSAQDGEMLAIIDADYLSKLRTGAATGVATRLLARDDAQTLAVIGTGEQAFTQIEAISAVRPPAQIRVFSRNEENRTNFASRVEEALHIETISALSAEACVRGADIVTTITKSPQPVLLGDWLEPGAHINAVGANAAARRELDDNAVSKAHVKCTDSLVQARTEAGEFMTLAQTRQMEWSEVSELGAIANGAASGRTAPTQVTLFKSLGIGVEDVALAEWIYRQALGKRIGADLPF